MPSTNRPTRSTRQTRTTRQASSIADEDVHATPKKATRKRAATNAIASSARSNPQTPVPSSTATKVGSATPRGLISSPANQRRIKGGSIPEESLSQPAPSMEESMEESMVREPAKIALGEMLSDVDSGLPLTAAQKKAYETFEKAKSRQFKTSDFLDRHTLPDQYRSALSVSTSTFASLIKLANLTSFVHLVLSSAPDPQTKKRSAESAENLKKASLQLMKTVVPETDQIDERIIRLVVDLKCQAYLATSADSAVPALDFFKDPLRSHRPSHDPSLPLNLRPKLTAMSNEALNLIESSASDRPALETRWKWNEFATSCKRWAQERKTGAPSGIYENPEEEEAETSEEPSERLSSRKINVDSDDEEEEMITQESNRSQTNDVKEGSNPDAERHEVPDLSSDSESEEEASAGEQDQQEEEEVNRSQAISRSPSKSSRSPKLQDQESDDTSDLGDLDLGTTGNVSEQDAAEVREPSSSMSDDAQIGDAAVATLEDINRSKPPAEVNERLRFDRKFQLQKVTSARHKSSILDRQEDAVKIPFDSQPEAEKSFDHRRSRSEIDNENDESKPRRKKGKKPSDKQNSPPATGSSRVGSTFSHEDQDQSEYLAPRSTKRSPAPPFDRNSEPLPEETRYSEPEREYGGGFDDDDDQQNGGIKVVTQPSPSNASLKTAGAAQRKPSGFGSGFGSNFAPPRSNLEASTSFSQPRASTSTDQPRPLPASSSKVPAKKNPRRAPKPASDSHFDSVSEDEDDKEEEEEYRQEEEEDEHLEERGGVYKSRKGKEKAVEAESSPRTSSPDSSRGSKRRREEEEAREARRRAKEKKKRRMDREETGRSDGERARRVDQRRVEEDDTPMPMVAGQGNLYHQDRNQSGARIPWTEEETDLLRKLLHAYGPDWRKMMELHGTKGSKSAVFRERTNVSLKDKAVNLAKNFIKSGQPIPNYLHGIRVPKSKLQPPARKAPIVNQTDDEDD